MENYSPGAGWRNVKLKSNPSDMKVGVALPVKGGQQSVPDSTYQSILAIGGTKYVETNPTFALEFLPILEFLALGHGDVNWAVKNLCNLANTPFKIVFHADEKDANKKKMLEYLEAVQDNWYMKGEPLRSFCNDLYTQLAVSGCIAAEFVPKDDLSGIKQIVRVWPFSIRVAMDPDTGDTKYFQRPRSWIYQNNNRSQASGYIELSPITFKYYGLQRIGNTMYPAPPLLPAIQPIITQKDVMKSVEKAMEKLGLFGALEAMFKPLEEVDGESPEQYRERNNAYLDKQIPALLKGFKNGMMVGFEGQHKLEFSASPSNVKGVKEVFDIVDDAVIQGIGQNGAFLNRQKTTTETFGRVLLEILKSEVGNMQFYVAQALKDLFELALALGGFSFLPFKIEFDKPTLGDILKEAQTDKMKTETVLLKISKNIITQDMGAQELGYAKAAGKAPVAPDPLKPSADPAGKKPGKTSPDGGTDTGLNVKALDAFLELSCHDRTEEIEILSKNLNSDLPVFNYDVPEEYINENGKDNKSFADIDINNEVDQYLGKIEKMYRKAVSKISPQIKEALKKLPETSDVQTVQDTILFVILSKWPDLFTNKLSGVIAGQISSTYKNFRSDKSIFIGNIQAPPTVNLSQPDYRAIAWSKGFDQVYLGKFITDPDTMKRFKSLIDEVYLEGSAPVGKNQAEIKNLIDRMGDQFTQEEFKVRRIVDTTVNRLRNAGNIAYLQQAGVTTYQIVEVMDRITCPHCRHLDGKTFDVQSNYDKVFDSFKMGFDEFAAQNPFATTVEIEKFTDLSVEELQEMGYTVPPFHPFCRGRCVTGE